MYTPDQLNKVLEELLSIPSETEVIEFKLAGKDYDFKKICKYFSALSNEANLKNKPYSWLIFGINDKQVIAGTDYRRNKKDLDHLKYELAEKINNRLTFIEIYEIETSKGRVILFQIPPAPQGIPTSFEGHYYGRDGESTGALNIEEIERIRRQIIQTDWSIGLCLGATIFDLDELALQKARDNYKIKNPRISFEVDNWDTITFLNKAKIIINGKITNTAILLLGKPESEHYLAPALARISWVLKNKNNEEKDYHHFSCPFLINIDEVFAKIRNLKYRYINDGTLFPEEVDRYDPSNIREALCNCIAHQDYQCAGKINVVEIEDEQIIFSNLGEFLPGSIENVLESDQPPALYRNSFLVQAMVNLNMIDTIGSGIKRMFRSQRNRFFPLPDYDLSGRMVKATITGKVLDLEYAKVLARHPDLSLEEIIMLDKVQKKKELSDNEINILKSKKLVEGRKPNFIISEHVANKTNQIGVYLKNRGFDKEYYKKLVFEYIEKHKKGVIKGDIKELLWKKLPDFLTDSQKETKISNILRDLRTENKIYNSGSDARPNWQVKK